MKPKVDFYIKPYRHSDMMGNMFYGIKIGFYVVDTYNPNRCQEFCNVHYLRLNEIPDDWQNVWHKNYDKIIYRRLLELLLYLERWEEQSDVLIDVIGNQWREYPKPLVYKIVEKFDGK